MEKEMNRTERKRAQTGYIAALLGFIAAVFVDQITKYLAVIFLKNKNPFVLIDGVFQLRYLENRGAAFGMMQNMQYLFCFSIWQNSLSEEIYSASYLRYSDLCRSCRKYDRPPETELCNRFLLF
jgi:lipoprotein signal peptidase